MRNLQLGLRFKGRDLDEGESYQSLQHLMKMPIAVWSRGIGLVDLLEGKVHQYYCETGIQSPEWQLDWAEPDETRYGTKFVFALKSRQRNGTYEYELLQFNLKLAP